MKSFGLTGGIATGKSTVGKLMKKLDPEIIIFDADKCVHDLYLQESVLVELEATFGKAVLDERGVLDRSYLREVVFADEEKKLQLEELIHPLVRKECLAMQAEWKHSGATSLFIADVPLLFEGGFDFGQSANLVVAVSRETQIQRLKMRSGFDDEMVLAILAAQLPISHKQKCADIVLWNEGPQAALELQVKRLINQYKL